MKKINSSIVYQFGKNPVCVGFVLKEWGGQMASDKKVAKFETWLKGH